MKTKRFLGVVLTLVMVVGLLLGITLTASAEVVESGNCGYSSYETRVTYTLDDEGKLIISGYGDIKPNAFQNRTDIKKVIIEEGIYKIHTYAFDGCTSLTSVELPISMETIYSRAFANTAVTSIVIPAKVTTLDGWAFSNCKSLEKVTYYGAFPIENSTYNYTVFNGCTALESVNVQPYYVGATFCGKTAVGGKIKPTETIIDEAVWGESETVLNNSGTFEEALTAATSENSTVKYIKLQTDLFPVYETNSTIQGYYKISSGKFTIDLNGNDIVFGNNGYTFYVYNSGTEVTFVDSADVDGTVYAAYYYGFSPINIKAGGSVIFNGGNYVGGSAISIYNAATDATSKAIVYDGTFTANQYIGDRVCVNNQRGEFVAYGGTFTSESKSVYSGTYGSTGVINGGTFLSTGNAEFLINASKLDLSNYSELINTTVMNSNAEAIIPGADTLVLPEGYGVCYNKLFVDKLEQNVIYTIDEIPEDIYNITTQSTKGSVSANCSMAQFEAEVELTLTPDENCEFVSLTVTDSYGNTIEVKDNKFLMPASDVTINAVFGDKDKVFTITLNATYGDCEYVSIPTTEEGVLASLLPTPTATDTIEEGYWIKGWYDAEEGENEITDTTVFTQDTTIYAQWDIVKPEIVSWDSEVVKFTWAKSGTTPMIILADYENDRLVNIQVMENAKVSKTEVGKTATGWKAEITLGKGDKIMILENFTTCKPLCEAYIVTGNEKVEYEDDNPGIDLPIDRT